ncbi:MAG: synthase subcomplex gamma subunit, partial [Bacteroidetes bacterium]|nr:synthase subcomplex gamma subunit [Bacteroidota bacterium]
MKMVSSAKLRKAQRAIEAAYPYEQKMTEIFNHFINSQDVVGVSPFLVTREVKHVAIVAFSSNSSLCGSFNANIAKQLVQTLSTRSQLGNENIRLISIGKNISKFCRKIGFKPDEYDDMADKPDYKKTLELSDKLMKLYTDEAVDEITLIYHHFVSKGHQVIT